MANPTQAVLTRLAGPVTLTAATETAVYTCTGTGILGALVKQLRFSMPSGTPQQVSWGILPSGGTLGSGPRWLLELMDLAPADPVTDNVTQVLNVGDKIIALATGSGVTLTISGATLQ